MSPLLRSGLRVVCTLALAAVGVAGTALASSPSAVLDIPLEDEGATAEVWVSGGCFGCSVTNPLGTLTKDFSAGAELSLPQGEGSAAGLRMDLGVPRAVWSRVGFVIRVEDGGDRVLDDLRLSLWTGGELAPFAVLDGAAAFDAQTVSGGRYFVSTRASASTTAMSLELSGSAAGSARVEILHAGIVDEAYLAPYAALEIDGARASVRASADCTGCKASHARRMVDGRSDRFASIRLDEGGTGSARAKVRVATPIAAGDWVGYRVANAGGDPMAGVPDGVALVFHSTTAAAGRSDGLRAEARSDGSVFLWSRVGVDVDMVTLKVEQGDTSVHFQVRAMEVVPVAIPDEAFPVDKPVVLAGATLRTDEGVATGLALRAAPNPFRSATSVAVDADGPVRIDAFDALGRHVAVVHDGPVAGAVRFDGGTLPRGVYLLRATDAAGATAQIAVTLAR